MGWRILVRSYWHYILLASAVLFNAACVSTVWNPLPSRDAGVYLYIGEHIIRGTIPYRDIWDHKPPGIHYLNALGLWLGQGSVWGVWLLEVLTLVLAAWLSLRLLSRSFGPLAAIFATIQWLVTAPLLLGGGNTPEEFALPIQFAALMMMVMLNEQSSSATLFRSGVIIGGLALAAFTLKPTLLGLWIAFIIVFGARCLRHGRYLALVVLVTGVTTGATIGGGLLALFFAAHGALGSAIEAVFRYNAAYVAVSTGERLQTIILGLQITALSGLVVFALMGWGAILVLSRQAQAPVDGTATWVLTRIALVAFPIEWGLASLSGRAYAHYFLPWLPVCAILVAHVIKLYVDRIARYAVATRQGGQRGERFVVLLLLFLCLTPLGVAAYQENQVGQRTVGQQVVIDTITMLTPSGRTVLMWGAETTVNFVIRRDAPTKFVYQLPLYTANNQSQAMRAAFLRDIMANPPATIVDASANTVDDSIPPLDPSLRRMWLTRHPALADDATLSALFDYIDQHYRVVRVVTGDLWPIYIHRGAGNIGVRYSSTTPHP
jgi:hypothetical protein